MSAITHLYAGVPVSDLKAVIDWYTRFFGRPPDHRAGEEMLWEVAALAATVLVRLFRQGGSPSSTPPRGTD